MLEDDLADLLPELRPYQRRAAYWMVKREKGDVERVGGNERSQIVSPLCIPLNLINTSRRIYYNPFRYVFRIFALSKIYLHFEHLGGFYASFPSPIQLRLTT